MIRVKLMLQTLLNTNPSHQDEPFQSIMHQNRIYVISHMFKSGLCILHFQVDVEDF